MMLIIGESDLRDKIDHACAQAAISSVNRGEVLGPESIEDLKRRFPLPLPSVLELHLQAIKSGAIKKRAGRPPKPKFVRPSQRAKLLIRYHQELDTARLKRPWSQSPSSIALGIVRKEFDLCHIGDRSVLNMITRFKEDDVVRFYVRSILRKMQSEEDARLDRLCGDDKIETVTSHVAI